MTPDYGARAPNPPYAPPLLCKPLDEPAQELYPDFVFADLVFDTVFEIGIVVDLHHDEAVGGLLDVDAVESFADWTRSTYRDVDQGGRRMLDVEGPEPAFARRAVGTMLDDLP